MTLELLADRPEFIPLIAHWYFQEWGHKEKSRTLQSEIEKLHSYLNKKSPPLILLATHHEELLGAAQLKYHEMTIYPEKEHWLGGVFVSATHRGRGIATKIITRLISMAKEMNIPKLYLQTVDLSGGLYGRMGWSPLEVVNYREVDVLVMERSI